MPSTLNPDPDTTQEISIEQRFLAHVSGDGGEPRNVFLTGMAGTGKSHLLRQWLDMAPPDKRIVLTASTGIAALNIGGMTIHRWAGIGIGDKPLQQLILNVTRSTFPYYQELKYRIQSTDIIVIDEISMLGGFFLNYLNAFFKGVREDPRPFGGIQIVSTGDFLQLPPVRKDGSKPYDWAFNAKAWAEADFKSFQLTKVHRQTDPFFIKMLAGVRMGEFKGREGAMLANLLRSRVSSFPDSSITRIFPTNLAVKKWNSAQIDDLPGDPITYTMETNADLSDDNEQKALSFLKSNMPAEETLVLKPGCLVMVTVNTYHRDLGWDDAMNGEVGEFLEYSVSHDGLVVRLSGGRTTLIKRRAWAYDAGDDFRKNRPEQEPKGVWVKQFPVRLAYAMTIHKSQGMTLDAGYVDIRQAREPGQAYVALSRFRTKEGLFLQEMPKGIVTNPEPKAFYASIES